MVHLIQLSWSYLIIFDHLWSSFSHPTLNAGQPQWVFLMLPMVIMSASWDNNPTFFANCWIKQSGNIAALRHQERHGYVSTIQNQLPTDPQRLTFSVVERILRMVQFQNHITHITITKELENPSKVSTCAYPRGNLTITAHNCTKTNMRWNIVRHIEVFLNHLSHRLCTLYPIDIIFHIHSSISYSKIWILVNPATTMPATAAQQPLPKSSSAMAVDCDGLV